MSKNPANILETLPPLDTEGISHHERLLSEERQLLTTQYRGALSATLTDKASGKVLAERLIDSGDNQAAMEVLDKLISLDPGDLDILALLNIAYANFLGSQRFAEGRFDESAKYYNDALKLTPNKSIIYTSLGAALAQSGEHGEALKVLDRGEKYCANRTEIYKFRGRIFNHMGAFPKAIGELRKAIKSNPFDAESWYSLAISLTSNEQYKPAIIILEKLIQIHPENYEMHSAIGNANLVLENYEAAIKAFEASIQINPTAGAHYNLGFAKASVAEDIAEMTKGVHEALAVAGTSPSRRGDDTKICKQIESAMKKLGFIEEQISALKKLIQLDPENPLNYNHLSMALSNVGKYSEALVVAQELQSLIRTNAQYHQYAAQVEEFIEKLQIMVAKSKGKD